MADKPKAQHAKKRPGAKLMVGVVVAVAVAVGGAAVAYTVIRHSATGPGSAIGPGTTSTTEAISLLVQPPDGSTNVGLDTIVSVTAQTGRISSVTVAAEDGRTVAGSVTPGGTTWRSSGTLSLKTDYTVTIDAQMPSGKATEQVTHFKSLVPTATLGVSIAPATGLTVGIGEPVTLRFDHAVANKDALVALLKVTESTPVPSGWHWFSNRELHLRPQQYWPPGEKVTVTADLTAFNAGNGIWGDSKASTSFTVGDAHVTTANVQTHQMTVTNNGAVLWTYPISAGRTKYPTMNGIHLDLYRQQDVHMVSSSVGIPVHSADGYDEHVYWDVNISDGGEFVHAAPWSTGAQGNSNVSHGCINLAPGAAQQFFNFSRVGDIIEVTGSPRAPDLGDHGTMDWNLPWAQWSAATVA